MTREQIDRILRTAPPGSNAWYAAMSAHARTKKLVYNRVTCHTHWRLV
jgi:hypothetical protein